MPVTLITNSHNHKCHELFGARPDWTKADWEAYSSEVAGLPADIRSAGAFLGLAYLFERAARAEDRTADTANRKLKAQEWIMADLARLTGDIDALDADAAELRRALGDWVEGFGNITAVREYMDRSDKLMRALDVLKRQAGFRKVLAAATDAEVET